MQGEAAAGGTLHRRRPAAAAPPSPAVPGEPLQRGQGAIKFEPSTGIQVVPKRERVHYS